MKYFDKKLLEEPIPKCTIYQSIYNNNKNYPQDIAINYFGNKISYRKMFLSVDRCTKALHKIGIKRGDCVTLCTAGIPESVYTVLACSRIGAIANFINPLFPKKQMVDRINETDADWIFVLDEMYQYVEAALKDTCVKNVVIIPVTNSISPLLAKLFFAKSKARKILKKKHDKKFYLYNEFAAIGRDYIGEMGSPYEEDTPAVMVYSSGTTGASKGILLTNDGINAIIQNYKNGVAINYYGNRITYNELFKQINTISYSFLEYGVKPGDVVTLVTLSCIPSVLCLYSLNRIGAVSNYLNVLASPKELEENIKEAGSKIVISLDLFADKTLRAAKAAKAKSVIVYTLGTGMPLPAQVGLKYKMRKLDKSFYRDPIVLLWNDFISCKNKDCLDIKKDPIKPCYLAHTGGTTGIPKSVLLNDISFNSVVQHYIRTVPHKKGEVYLSMLIPYAKIGVLKRVLMKKKEAFSDKAVVHAASRTAVVLQGAEEKGIS